MKQLTLHDFRSYAKKMLILTSLSEHDRTPPDLCCASNLQAMRFHGNECSGWGDGRCVAPKDRDMERKREH